MQFSAILFDHDGTLVDSESLWLDAELAVLAAHGKTYDAERHSQTVGNAIDKAMAIMRDLYDIEDEIENIVGAVMDRFKILLEDAKLLPGAAEILQYTIDEDIPRALVSNSSRDIVEITLRVQGWRDMFQAVCPVDAAPNPKPAPDLYQRAAQIIGVPVEECLVIEDSITGARAGVASGATCFVVPDSHPPEAFAEITAHVFEDLHAVLRHLRAG